MLLSEQVMTCQMKSTVNKYKEKNRRGKQSHHVDTLMCSKLAITPLKDLAVITQENIIFMLSSRLKKQMEHWGLIGKEKMNKTKSVIAQFCYMVYSSLYFISKEKKKIKKFS